VTEKPNFFDNVTLQAILGDLGHVVALERWGPKISQRVIWRAPIHERKIALTFDDGPHPVYTPKVLEVLERFKVPATFFLIGKHVQNNLTLARETVQAGHEVGNHTFTHRRLWRLTDINMFDEIKRTDEVLRNLNGVAPRFLRPPMGAFSKRVLNNVESVGYKTVIGNVYPRDSHLPSKEKILSRVLSRIIKGSIIILHDGGNTNHVDRSRTIWAAERFIPELQERGFEFVTLSDLLGHI